MESVLENKENVMRGCLKLNDKIYPVYEGHNTVGRNPDAVINIKNLNVSKNHAVITVVDENSHYLSDFKSSNGTVLDSEKLTPLQLYKLDNGASIKFGDVFCTYKKLDTKEIFQRSLEESQQCNESFYSTGTQELLLPNLPEGICFNEMQTQVFRTKDLSINEMPTQVFNYSDHDNSSNDSIDFATMKKATESQVFRDVDSGENKVSARNLETESDTDDDLVATPSASGDKNSASQIHPINVNSRIADSDAGKETLTPSGSSDKNSVSSEIHPVSFNSRRIADSDADGETLTSSASSDKNSASSQIHPVSLNSRRIADSDADDESSSQIQPVKTGKKNMIDSDSDTEEYEPLHQSNQSRYHISDSETDIDEDEDKNDKKKPDDLVSQNDKSKSEDSSMADFMLELSESAEGGDEEKFEKPKKINKKVLPQDHIYCQSFSETQQTQNLEETVSHEKIRTNLKITEEQNQEENQEVKVASGEITGSSADEPAEDLESARNEDLESVRNEDLDSTKNENLESAKNEDLESTRNENLEDCFAPTVEKDEPAEDLKSAKNEDLGDSFAPTVEKDDIIMKCPGSEPFIEDKEEQKSNFPPSEEIHAADDQDAEEDVSQRTTQTLDLLDDENPDDSLKVLVGRDPCLSSTSEEVDEIFLQPTQVMETAKVSRSPVPEEEEEDEIFLQPTQALESLHGEIQIEKSIASGDLSPPNDIPTTQALESLLDDQAGPSSSKKDSTLGDTLGTNQSNSEDANLFLPKTPDLECLLNEEVSEPQSSSKNDDVFLSPKLVKKSTPKKASPMQKLPEKIIEEDDDDILPPTQALEVMHKDEEHFNKVEDQLHEIFASQSLLCTQQLVDVLEVSCKDDIIDDSIQESEKSVNLPNLSFKKSEPMSAESVKEILAEDFIKQEERGGKKLRTYTRKKDKVEESEVGERNLKNEDDEKSDGDKLKGPDDVDQGATKRRGRPKQNLTTGAEVSKEEPKTSKNEINENKKGRSRRKQILPTSDDPELIILDDVQHSRKQKDSENEDVAEGKRGNRRKQDLDIDRKEESSMRSTRQQTVTLLASEEPTTKKESEDKEIKKGRGRRKQNIPDESESSNEGAKSSSQNSSNEGSERSKRIGTKKDSGEQNSEKNEEVKGRGRRKQTLANSADKSSNIKEDSSENNTTNEEDRRKGRKKPVASVTQEKEDTKENKDSVKKGKDRQNLISARVVNKEDDSDTEENKESIKKGKGRQNLISSRAENKKDESEHSGNDGSEGRRTKRNQNIATSSNAQSEEQNVATRSKKGASKTDESGSEATNTRPKRKKDEVDKTDETPTKKTAGNEEKPSTRATTSKKEASIVAATPKKRASDSEDEFVPKVPKIATPIKKSTRLRKPRKIYEDEENSEEVITLTSIPSKSETIISISSTSTVAELTQKQRRLSANSKRQKKENEEKNKTVSILPTPERNRRLLKPKVVFTMMDNPELESLIRQLGGSVVDTVEACTVLVTENVKRSLKLLCAVAQGKPICSPEWLRECKRKFAFVDPWDYILVDKEAEKKWKFSLRESLNRSTKVKLLENYTFQVIVNNAADVLKGAIEACGGKCVTRNLPKCDTDNLVIVSSENNKSKFIKVVKQNSKIIVVEAEAIFDGTLRQEFCFNKYLIN